MKIVKGETIQRLNINISKEAKIRLGDLQIKVRAQAENLSAQETTPGKLIEKLILYKDAFEVLQEEFGLHG
jgi:hypothetical protein